MESAVETIVILDWEQSLGRREVFRMLYSGLLKSNELPINFDALLPRHSWPEEGQSLRTDLCTCRVYL